MDPPPPQQATPQPTPHQRITAHPFPFPTIPLPETPYEDAHFRDLLAHGITPNNFLSDVELAFGRSLQTKNKKRRTALQTEQFTLILSRLAFQRRFHIYAQQEHKPIDPHPVTPKPLDAQTPLHPITIPLFPFPIIVLPKDWLNKPVATQFDQLITNGVTPQSLLSPEEIALNLQLSSTSKKKRTALQLEQLQHMNRRTQFRAEFKKYYSKQLKAQKMAPQPQPTHPPLTTPFPFAVHTSTSFQSQEPTPIPITINPHPTPATPDPLSTATPQPQQPQPALNWITISLLPFPIIFLSTDELNSPTATTFHELVTNDVTPKSLLSPEETKLNAQLSSINKQQRTALQTEQLQYLNHRVQFRAQFKQYFRANPPPTAPPTAPPTMSHQPQPQASPQPHPPPLTSPVSQPPLNRSTISLLPFSIIVLSKDCLDKPAAVHFDELIANGIAPDSLLSPEEITLNSQLTSINKHQRTALQTEQLQYTHRRLQFRAEFTKHCLKQPPVQKMAPQPQPQALTQPHLASHSTIQPPLTTHPNSEPEPSLIPTTISLFSFPITFLPNDWLDKPAVAHFDQLIAKGITPGSLLSSQETTLYTQLSCIKKKLRIALQTEQLQYLNRRSLFRAQFKKYFAANQQKHVADYPQSFLPTKVPLFPFPIIVLSQTLLKTSNENCFRQLLANDISPTKFFSPAEKQLKRSLGFIPTKERTLTQIEQAKCLKNRLKFYSQFKDYCNLDLSPNIDQPRYISAMPDDAEQTKSNFEDQLAPLTYHPTLPSHALGVTDDADAHNEDQDDYDDEDDDWDDEEEAKYETFRDEFTAQFDASDALDYNANCQVLYDSGITVDFFSSHEQRYFDQLQNMHATFPLTGSRKLHLDYFLARETFRTTVYLPFVSSQTADSDQ